MLDLQDKLHDSTEAQKYPYRTVHIESLYRIRQILIQPNYTVVGYRPAPLPWLRATQLSFPSIHVSIRSCQGMLVNQRPRHLPSE